MRIDGCWVEDERVSRPFVLARVETATGVWVESPFQVDTGADKTVFAAALLLQLSRRTTLAPVRLGGVGGSVETMQVHAGLRFTTTEGTPVVVNGDYAAFTDPAALEYSVLGWDVLGHF